MMKLSPSLPNNRSLRDLSPRAPTTRAIRHRTGPRENGGLSLRSEDASASAWAAGNAVLPLFVLICFSLLAAKAADVPVKAIQIAKLKRSSTVDFEREILPILKNNCIACHNQTKPKGGLILETPQTILKGGDAGPSVVARKPAESLLLKAAAHQDPELIMPPPDNKVAAVALKPGELGLLQLWIEQGAKGEVRPSAPIVWQPIPPALHSIYALALTRDGQFAACGRANQIFVYHLPTSNLVARLRDPQLQKTSTGLASHRDTVNSLAFSPDGEWLASGGYREVKLWRRSKPTQKFKLPTGSHLAAASADGQWFAAASTNGNVRILDRTGTEVKKFAPLSEPVTRLQFIPGTNVLAVVRGKTVQMHSVPSGHLLSQAALPDSVTSLCAIGGRLAAVCGDNVIRILAPGTNVAGLIITTEMKSPSPVKALVASAISSNQFLAGSPDGTIRLWDVSRAAIASEWKHGDELALLAMRPDGKYFASAGGKSGKLWRLGESNAVGQLNSDGPGAFLVAETEREAAFAKSEVGYRKSTLQAVETNLTSALTRQKTASETNALLAKVAEEKQTALTNAALAVAEAESAIAALGPEITKALENLTAAEKDFTNATAHAKAAKDGQDKAKLEKLIEESVAKSNLLAEAKAAVEALPAETKAKQKTATDKLSSAKKALTKAEKEFTTAAQVRSLNENELNLATKGVDKTKGAVKDARSLLASAEAALKSAEEAGRKAREKFVQPQPTIQGLEFSPDNRTLFTSHADGSLRSWGAESGRPLATTTLSTTPPKSFVIGAGNVALAINDSGGAAWEVGANWTLTQVIGTGDANSRLADRVNALRFTSDGKQLFTGGGEPTRGGEIKSWRIRDGAFLRDYPNVHSDSVFALDLSADGKYLASGAADRFARIVDLESGKVLKTLEGHTHHVLGVAWKRDNRTVITTGADNVAKVWDATTGERRKNIDGFGKEITAATFVGVSDEVVLCAGDAQVVLMKEKGDKIRSFTGATDYLYSTAATPDGEIIVAGGADGTLRAWNGKTGKLIAAFPNR